MVVYLFLINALALALMLADKAAAKFHRNRIPEALLLFFAAAGASLGILLGMWLFHHKTQKPVFYLTVPILFGIHILILLR